MTVATHDCHDQRAARRAADCRCPVVARLALRMHGAEFVGLAKSNSWTAGEAAQVLKVVQFARDRGRHRALRLAGWRAGLGNAGPWTR